MTDYKFWKEDVFEGLEDKWLEDRVYESLPVITESNEKYSFIKGEIAEARYIRIPRQAAGHTMADIGETFFEHMIMLQQLRYEDPEEAARYAKETIKFANFTNVRSNGTDLHNLASIILNPSKFADEVGTNDNINIPELAFKRYLRDVKGNNIRPSIDRQFFYNLEKNLGIKNGILKRMRRIVQDYTMSTPQERNMIATRLMLHFRQDRRFMSDIFKPWSKAAKNMVPKPDDVENAESKGFKIPGWVKTAAIVAGSWYLGKKLADLAT